MVNWLGRAEQGVKKEPAIISGGQLWKGDRSSTSSFDYTISGNTKAFTGSERGSEMATEAIGFYRSQRH